MGTSRCMASGKCPPGLEPLLPTSSLVVKQKIDLIEAAIGFQEQNGYIVFNERGEPLFWVFEKSSILGRLCFYAADRPLELRVVNAAQRREVLVLRKPLRCSCCFCFCCLPVIEVYLTTGVFLGVVQQRCRIFYPEFDVKDAAGNLIFIIRGPIFKYCVSTFTILSSNRCFVLGQIQKRWSGFLRELLTSADFFGISYPNDLAVSVKALLLGAVFLIVSADLFLQN